jgi:hypothetical protein
MIGVVPYLFLAGSPMRLCFLVLFALPAAWLLADTIDPKTAKSEGDPPTLWYDIRALGVEGQGWADTKAPFDRLPAKAEKLVRPEVWGLSHHSAGLAVRFVTDAKVLSARWTLTNKRLEMPHMPATGVSGLDLYVKAPDGKYRWVANGRPTQVTNTAKLVEGLDGQAREYLLYLPLYNGVESVEIGLPEKATLKKAAPRPEDRRRPLVFYGTSITQGGCASRPGMVHTAILGRRFERPVINLGFSGNGKMEPEIARLLGEIDAEVYVLDCLPNLTAKEVKERTVPFIKILREARPKTPILLVEDRSYTNGHLLTGQAERNKANRAALKEAFESLTKEGVPGLSYLRGDLLLGDDSEATVDGSHPTDLGFVRQADMFADALAPLLSQPKRGAWLDGYPGRLSVAPGDKLALHLAGSTGSAKLEIARLGAERKVVFTREEVKLSPEPTPPDASANGCHWPVSLTLDVPRDWKTGYYNVRLTAPGAEGKPIQSNGFFVVRSAEPGVEAKILLQLATNTYNAYCNWGGYSLYAYNGRYKVQGRRVSFERPIEGQFARWEADFVAWAEKAGYALDYAANLDLEQHPDELAKYRLILSVGHDEYWSSGMRDALEKFIGAGGNVAFLSGNTCCWQVRPEEHGQALRCYKQAFVQDPLYTGDRNALLSTLWSHHLVNRPENQLTGVGFPWGGYRKSHGQFMTEKAEFTVHRPDHWLFEGTNLKRGDTFGAKDSIVGYECDGCELTWRDGLPYATHADGTPKSFTVLATCPARWHPDDSDWYDRFEKGRTGNSVMGLYERGGTVVTVGTTDWSRGLRGNDPAVVRITRNVLDRLGK